MLSAKTIVQFSAQINSLYLFALHLATFVNIRCKGTEKLGILITFVADFIRFVICVTSSSVSLS